MLRPSCGSLLSLQSPQVLNKLCGFFLAVHRFALADDC